MNLTGLHILLTYTCNYECDHCFVWGSPWQTGVFTMAQLKDVLYQAREVGTITEIYFEGGEAFLYYPLLLEGVRLASALGFSVGIVSNGYWATSEEDACQWLKPLAQAGLKSIDVSSDLFHGKALETPESQRVLAVAPMLGLATGTITVDAPAGARDPDEALEQSWTHSATSWFSSEPRSRSCGLSVACSRPERSSGPRCAS